jgi:hypothetical protein
VRPASGQAADEESEAGQHSGGLQTKRKSER